MYEDNKLISARVTLELHDLVAEVSLARGENISSFLRRAILRELGRLSYLTEDVKKALDVPHGPERVVA